MLFGCMDPEGYKLEPILMLRKTQVEGATFMFQIIFCQDLALQVNSAGVPSSPP